MIRLHHTAATNGYPTFAFLLSAAICFAGLPSAWGSEVHYLECEVAKTAPHAALRFAQPERIQKEEQKDKKKEGESDKKEGTDKDTEDAKDDKKKEAGKDPIERLKKWPAIQDAPATKKAISRLVKARTETMGTDAAATLLKIGASAAPDLIKALKKTRDEAVTKRITDTLDGITGAAHTRLWAEHFKDKKVTLRRYAMHRVALLPDAGTKEAAEAAYKFGQTSKSRWEARDKYLSALCCAAAGSKVGWEDLVKVSRSKWGKYRADLSIALPPLRSDETTKTLVDTLGAGERQDKVDCLRLLSLVGTKTAIDFVKPLLDSGDASLRVAAINACRGIVDRDPPLDNISAFTAIELAKKWKERL